MNITITGIDKTKAKNARDILKKRGLNFQAVNQIILNGAYQDIINNNYDNIIKLLFSEGKDDSSI